MSEQQESIGIHDDSKYLGADMPVGFDETSKRDKAQPEPMTDREKIELLLEGVYTQGLADGADAYRHNQQVVQNKALTGQEKVYPDTLWKASSIREESIDRILELVLHLANVNNDE